MSRLCPLVALLMLADVVCAGCGSGDPHPSPPSDISLQQVPGNTAAWHLYTITIRDGRRVSVTLRARTVKLTPMTATGVESTAAGTSTLTAAQRRALAGAVAHVTAAEVTASGTPGGCHGMPVGDGGGELLTLGRAHTDCPPTSAQPLVNWLESTARQVPLKITGRRTHTSPIAR